MGDAAQLVRGRLAVPRGVVGGNDKQQWRVFFVLRVGVHLSTSFLRLLLVASVMRRAVACLLLLACTCGVQASLFDSLQSGLPPGGAARAATCAAEADTQPVNPALAGRCESAVSALGDVSTATTSSSDWADDPLSWAARVAALGDDQAQALLVGVCDPGDSTSTLSCADELDSRSQAFLRVLAVPPQPPLIPGCSPATATAAANAASSALHVATVAACSRSSAAAGAPYCLIALARAVAGAGDLLDRLLAGGAPSAADAAELCPALADAGCCASAMLLAAQQTAALTCAADARRATLSSFASLLGLGCTLGGSPLAPACADVAAAAAASATAPSAQQCALLRSLNDGDNPPCWLAEGQCPSDGCELYCGTARASQPVGDRWRDRPAAPPWPSLPPSLPPPPPPMQTPQPAKASLSSGGHGGAMAGATAVVVFAGLGGAMAFLHRSGRLEGLGEGCRALLLRARGGGGAAEAHDGFELMINDESDERR